MNGHRSTLRAEGVNYSIPNEGSLLSITCGTDEAPVRLQGPLRISHGRTRLNTESGRLMPNVQLNIDRASGAAVSMNPSCDPPDNGI